MTTENFDKQTVNQIEKEIFQVNEPVEVSSDLDNWYFQFITSDAAEDTIERQRHTESYFHLKKLLQVVINKANPKSFNGFAVYGADI